jgi:hypothetical protein
MLKNVASQRWAVFAYYDDGGTTPGDPVTGDAANITGTLYIDGASNTIDDANPTELGGGYYNFDITAAESNGDHIVMVASSSTANVNVIGVPGALWTTQTAGIKKNQAFSNFEFLMVDETDGHTAETGLTVTGERSIDGGAFAAVSGTIAEVGQGIYQFDALAADCNGDVVTWRFIATGAADAFFTFKTV